MRRLAPFAIVAILAACATTHEGKVAQVKATYTSIANNLVAARTAGKINDESWAEIKAADRVAWQAVQDFASGTATLVAVDNALAALAAHLSQGVE